jgi:aryl-alcohol dehydrogenase-like predicted oxidoreductase
MRFLEESKYNHLPRIKTVQNPYSFEQTFENASSEVCMRENVGLLAYSPMAFGVLSGKFYQGKVIPTPTQFVPTDARYNSAQVLRQPACIRKSHIKWFNLSYLWLLLSNSLS